MEGVEVKFHLHKGYEEEGHKCVEVTMVEEPQHCFSQIHSNHEIVMVWCLCSYQHAMAVATDAHLVAMERKVVAM
jgi:hypothetical protein